MGLGALSDGLAPTPPMGWNTWNRFGPFVGERLVRESAEALIETGMRDAGYRYVVVDDAWQGSLRDDDGGLPANPWAFPSGMRALGDFLHERGLRFGLYTDAGRRSCQGYPGSLGREPEDARRFADWGVDFMKVDWCHTEGLDAPRVYRRWCDAVLATKRPMLLSICEWGRSRPWEWAGAVGHLWRTTGDIQDRWEDVVAIAERQAELHPHSGPDHWNDPDMLEVGNGGMSESECRAHFGLWAILAAPLMAGNDVRAMSEVTREILTAPEVIAVDQDPLGRQGRRVRATPGAQVWARELADGARAVLLLNAGERPATISVSWTDVGLAPGDVALVRDLWGRQDVGARAEGYEAMVPPHDAALVRVRSATP